MVETRLPVLRFGEGICRRASQNRDRQQPRPNDAEAEEDKGKIAGDRLQRFGDIRGRVDIGLSVGVQRRGRANHDRDSDDRGNGHPREGIKLDPVQLFRSLRRCLLKRLGFLLAIDLLDLLTLLPEE